MNILVTGANGQLGNELRCLSSTYPQVHFVFTDVEELDITDADAINKMVSAENIDLLINCAAYTAVDKAESNAELAHMLNAVAPETLAKAMEAVGGDIIHVSTDYVFDGQGHEPYTEDMEANPQSVYGRTKWEGEQRVSMANPRHIIIRTAWLYSPFGNNFVKTMIRLGNECESLGVVWDQAGTPTYARDLASAIMQVAVAKDKVYGTFHYSNEGLTSWFDFTKAIHRLAGITSCQVNPIRTAEYPTPAQRPAYSVLDKSKIKKAYNIQIPYWEESLCDCIERLK